jgi:hypothetical protein
MCQLNSVLLFEESNFRITAHNVLSTLGTNYSDKLGGKLGRATVPFRER